MGARSLRGGGDGWGAVGASVAIVIDAMEGTCEHMQFSRLLCPEFLFDQSGMW